MRSILWAPALCLLVLVGLSFLPSVADRPTLAWSFRIAAAALVAWGALLLATLDRRTTPLTWQPSIKRPHWVQGCVHTSIFVYWGWHWPEVYAHAPHILAQIAFLLAFDALLSWSRPSRGSTWYAGFGPVPIVLSTNLFLWFRDEYFVLQFGMLALGALGKNLIRWERDGRRTHIFNPSALALSVVSILLIVTENTGMTWGREIAATLDYPDHIFVWIFVVGLLVQYLFHVTLMTFAAAGTLWVLTEIWFAATGLHFFVDTTIPIAVFLGLHLLVTDPSTSPRTRVGRVLFGSLYGAGVFLLFWWFIEIGVPTFYDKLLAVPFLNLSVQLIDRLAARVRLPRTVPDLTPARRNLAHMGAWAGVFSIMYAGGALGDAHEGRDPAFWEARCTGGNLSACEPWRFVLSGHCEGGTWAACNALGVALTESPDGVNEPEAAAVVFRRACEGGIPHGCANLGAMLAKGEGVPVDLRAAAAHLQSACDSGLAPACQDAAQVRAALKRRAADRPF
ncbi:MAG: tetratricopeptide repeat protein [Planctomycetota bacterium]